MKDKIVSIRVKMTHDEYLKLVKDTLQAAADEGRHLTEGEFLKSVWLAEKSTTAKMFKTGAK